MSASRNAHFPVLDGGIAWFTVLAGAISNFIAMGLYRSGGIIYMESVKHFSASRSVAAWIPMTTISLVFLTAPLGNYLATRFTFHWTIILGGIIATIGMIINFLATDFTTLFIGWSIFFGIGSSIAFYPSLSVVSQCFKAKRPLANGIVLAGSGVGGFCLSPLLEYLIDIYGLNGACLVIAGVVMQYMIVGLLLRTVYNVICKRKQVLEPMIDTNANVSSKSFFRLELPFIKNCTFYINAITNAIQTALFFATLTILPDSAVEEMGVSRIEGAYFVSAIAFADMFSRLPAGVLLLKVKLRKTTIYMSVLVINVLDLLLLAFVRDYYIAMTAAAVGGICFAFGIILYFEILASCQRPEKFPIAFGFSEMIKAPFLLITATSIGSLKDATGSYSTTFLIFSAVQSLAVALWMFEILNERRKSGGNKIEVN